MLIDSEKEKLTLLLSRTFGKTEFNEEEFTRKFWSELRIRSDDFFLTEDGCFDVDFFWSDEVRDWILADKQAWINEHNLSAEVKRAQQERIFECLHEHCNADQLNIFRAKERKIYYYKNDGSLEGEEPLNIECLGNINGMMVKCHMKNGTIQIGFADPYRTLNEAEYTGEVKDVIYLWTWDNIDESAHRLIGDDDDKYSQTFIPVKIKYIIRIDAILFSNPRWGGLLTNKFYIDEK